MTTTTTRRARRVAGDPKPQTFAVVIAVILGLVLLALVHIGASRAATSSRPTTTAAAHPYDYVAAKATDLNENADAMVAFVRASIAPDTYPGALRGPVGTLWAGSGNDLDRALLLRALLAHTKRTSQLVHGAQWGVTMDDGNGDMTYVGPTLARDDAAIVATPPESAYQTASVTVRTTDSNGKNTDEAAGSWHTADLSSHDIAVAYTTTGRRRS